MRINSLLLSSAAEPQHDPTMEEILADYEDLEREDLLAALAYASRLSDTKRFALTA